MSLIRLPIRLTKYRKKHLMSVIFLTCLFTTLILTIHIPIPGFVMNIYYWIKPDKSVFCHYIRTKEEDNLPDISAAVPKEGQSIFFHETSCNSLINGKITIKARQACAVESAALMNPHHEVYLLYASPGKFLFQNTESDRFLKELLKYPNVNILHLDLEKYFKDSPVENLYAEGIIRQSRFAQSHTSDVLRFLTLWKYGGIYLDLDVIVTKPLEGLGTDFSGIESNTSVAAGILSFNYTGIGHEYATDCLEDLKYNFKGSDWGWNGPGTVTRLLKRLCNVNKVPEMRNRTCKGFKIYPPSEFYSIPWWNWKWFFDPLQMDAINHATANSHIIHVWNKFSTTVKIPINSLGVPYLEFAKKYCPSIIKQCDQYF
ncbi:lactosylceramide 4-alpha-galactosyltransferase-like [Anthonomus grandis grandis]|uniref:lactosylceramide 4-alpha-galactosyltransferase-like n=1 Tax=Anthonomus grandis grandis TaxID=2921223 RepID=UPI0021653445|nr:lactosylceramide 4-alpha-galactosyltransferase-like [Anthonomus grandis grandis]XP_050298942.1 lactosylceramide 4-alpha-galactosyltransferase-like [Anthonomus grandis grandis]